MDSNKKWYQKTWAIVLLLVFFFPVGLFLMWKFTNWNKKLKWGITAFFIIMFIIGMVTDDTPQTATTATQSENKQEAAQETTSPTARPTKPKVTEASVDETAYTNKISEILENQASFMDEVSTLQDNPIEIFTNDERKFKLAIALAGMKLNYEETQKLTPPAKYKDFHTEFLSAMKLYSEGADYLARGIDNMDVDLINTATSKVTAGTAQLNKAETLYTEINK